MKVNHKLELLDQFDDAAFALMMDEYAEAEGERLRMEFEEATRAGLTPARPDSLDEKCRKQIRREFGKQRRREYASRGKSLALRAAACILVALCISATLIMSVEAIREPFWRFLTEKKDDYVLIDFDKENVSSLSEIIEPLEDLDPFVTCIPDGYIRNLYEIDSGRITACYENQNGNRINIIMSFSTNAEDLSVETEYDKEIILGGQRAMISEWDEIKQINFLLTDIETNVLVSTIGLDRNELLDIASYVKDRVDNLRINQPTVVPNALDGKLPQNYEELFVSSSGGFFYCTYISDDGKRIIVDTKTMEGGHQIFLDDPEVKECKVGEHEGVVMDGELRCIMWFEKERNLMFTTFTEGIAIDDHLALCEYLAEYYKNVTLPAISTVIWD